MSDKINISLNKEEALILFDFLSRFSESDFKLTIEDKAEERVLWNLCCDLEKILVEPFQENYRELLNQSREKLRDKNE
jgi:hypothetical protein